MKYDCQNYDINRLWVGDITYLRTGEGWVYLATVIDLFNREVVGFVALTGGLLIGGAMVANERQIRRISNHKDCGSLAFRMRCRWCGPSLAGCLLSGFHCAK